MKMNRMILCFLLLSPFGILTLAAKQNSTPSVASAKRDGAKSTGDTTENEQAEGERIFQRRCSNCHNAPDGFPAGISGTVVRHMRVRASLSRHEEEALLRFFNP